MPVLVVEPGKQKTTFTPTPTKKKMRSTGTPFEDAAVRTVELSADAFHEGLGNVDDQLQPLPVCAAAGR